MPKPKPVPVPPYQDQELREELLRAIDEYADDIAMWGRNAETGTQRAAVASAILAIERNACLRGIEAAKECRFHLYLDDYANQHGEIATDEAQDILGDWCNDLDRAVDATENAPRLTWAGQEYTESGKESKA